MDDVARDLTALEESLWRSETRFDSAYMEAVLAAGSFEIGRSGRIYDATKSWPLPLQTSA